MKTEFEYRFLDIDEMRGKLAAVVTLPIRQNPRNKKNPVIQQDFFHPSIELCFGRPIWFVEEKENGRVSDKKGEHS